MTRKTTHLRLTQASVALVFALVAPTVTHGASAVPSPASPRATADVVEGALVQVALNQVQRPERRTVEQRAVEIGQGGLGWRDAAVGLGIVLGVVLVGLWGDVAVGAVIMGVAALFGAGATLVSRKPPRDRTRSASRRQSGTLWPAPGQERR